MFMGRVAEWAVAISWYWLCTVEGTAPSVLFFVIGTATWYGEALLPEWGIS